MYLGLKIFGLPNALFLVLRLETNFQRFSFAYSGRTGYMQCMYQQLEMGMFIFNKATSSNVLLA